MLPALITQLFAVFLETYRKIQADHQAATGAQPTDAEILATFTTNVNQFISEGDAWLAAHPAKATKR